MTKFLKTKGLRLLVIVLAVVIIVAVATILRGGNAGPLSNVGASVSVPVKQAVASFADWLEGIYGYVYQYDQLAAENESLKSQLAQAQEALREAQDAMDENARLRQLLDLKEKRTDFVLESVRIIDRTASNWANTFTINKGESSGISLNCPVITESGALVGQVTEVGDDWATVRSIIDVDINVGALVGEAGSAAILAGDFSLMQDGYVKLTYLSEGTQLLEGDSVRTSGKGSVFPLGLLIGTIAEVHTEAGGQHPYGVVEPACDLDALGQAFVIKEFDMVE